MSLLINQTYANESTPLWGNGVSTVLGDNFANIVPIAAHQTANIGLPVDFIPKLGHTYQMGICLNITLDAGSSYKGLIGLVLNYNGTSTSVQARETTHVDSTDGPIQYSTSVTLAFPHTEATAGASYIIENRTDTDLMVSYYITNVFSVDLGTSFKQILLNPPAE